MTEVTLRHADLTSKPDGLSSLFAQSISQGWGSDESLTAHQSPHGDIVMPYGDSRNYRCRMASKTPTPETLSGWLRRQLDRRNWNQADLARHLGTTNGVVSRWFRGERMPSPEYADRIADVLGADRDIVLALAGHRALDEEIDPDSPKARIMGLVERIDWTEEKAIAIEGVLRMYLEADRKRSTQ